MTQLLGLDIGTTGCKAMVFAATARAWPGASREYADRRRSLAGRSRTPSGSGVWRGKPLRGRRRSGGRSTRSAGPLLPGRGGDAGRRGGTALRPAILGMDTRTTAKTPGSSRPSAPRSLFRRTGMPVHTINTLPKLLWLQRMNRRSGGHSSFCSTRTSSCAGSAAGGHQRLPGLAHADDGPGDRRLGRRHSCACAIERARLASRRRCRRCSGQAAPGTGGRGTWPRQ